MQTLTPKTNVPLGAVIAVGLTVFGGVWYTAWNMATMKSDIAYMKESQVMVIGKIDRLLWQQNGVSLAPKDE